MIGNTHGDLVISRVGHISQMSLMVYVTHSSITVCARVIINPDHRHLKVGMHSNIMNLRNLVSKHMAILSFPVTMIIIVGIIFIPITTVVC